MTSLKEPPTRVFADTDESSSSSLIAHWPVGVVIVIFLASFGLLMTGDAPPLVDESIFADSAFEWALSGTIEISELSSPIGVFDAVWGGLFVRLLGPTLDALRWGSIVLCAISGPFLYWTVLQLNRRRVVALLSTAAYLTSPLVVALTATAMTDMHGTSILVIASSFVVKSFTSAASQVRWLGIASLVSGVGFLSRPQALIVPIAGAIAWASKDRWVRRWLTKAGAVLLPAGMIVALYFSWEAQVGTPEIRALSLEFMIRRMGSDLPVFLGQALVMAAALPGLMILPLTPLLFRNRWPNISSPLRLFAVGTLPVVGFVSLVRGLDPTFRLEWVRRSGVGGLDLSYLGESPHLWPNWFHAVILIVAIASTALFVANIVHSGSTGRRPIEIYLLVAIAGVVGASAVTSMSLFSGIIDRYWLPVIPLALILAALKTTVTPPRVVMSVALAAILALFAFLGAHDSRTASREIVAWANEITADVEPTRFEGGASWSAITFGVPGDPDVEELLKRNGPYWMSFFATESEPQMGLSLEPLAGYRVLDRMEYGSILHVQPTFVYLIERGEQGEPYFPADFSWVGN